MINSRRRSHSRAEPIGLCNSRREMPKQWLLFAGVSSTLAFASFHITDPFFSRRIFLFRTLQSCPTVFMKSRFSESKGRRIRGVRSGVHCVRDVLVRGLRPSEQIAGRSRVFGENNGIRAESFKPDKREVRGSTPRWPIALPRNGLGCYGAMSFSGMVSIRGVDSLSRRAFV
jgi:hypothetical protein